MPWRDAEMILFLIFLAILGLLGLAGESPSTEMRHRIAAEGGMGPLGV
jgi:hypothetical protein